MRRKRGRYVLPDSRHCRKTPKASFSSLLAPGLVPGQENAAGKRPGLHRGQVHPAAEGGEERRAAADEDRVGDERVLVDQQARMAAAEIGKPTSWS